MTITSKKTTAPLDPELVRICIRRGGHIAKRGTGYFVVKSAPPARAEVRGTYAGQPVYVYR